MDLMPWSTLRNEKRLPVAQSLISKTIEYHTPATIAANRHPRRMRVEAIVDHQAKGAGHEKAFMGTLILPPDIAVNYEHAHMPNKTIPFKLMAYMRVVEDENEPWQTFQELTATLVE